MATHRRDPGLAILVTRPQGQAEQLQHSLEQRGHRVWHQPLLVLEPIPEPATAQRQCLLELDRYRHVIFVSANAVHYGMAWIADFWPQPPVGINWYAIGKATAELLGSYGVPVTAPGDEMSSEGLLAQPSLASIDGERVLIVRGEGGRTLLGDELVARGARVDALPCYRRKCPELSPGALAARLVNSGIQLILISSGEGLANLQALLTPRETTKFKHIALLVPSQRVADQAAELGFDQVMVADNASDAAMLRAVGAFTPGSGE